MRAGRANQAWLPSPNPLRDLSLSLWVALLPLPLGLSRFHNFSPPAPPLIPPIPIHILSPSPVTRSFSLLLPSPPAQSPS